MTQDGAESSGDEFTLESHLVRQAHGKRTYYCENCPDTFMNAHGLQEHIRTDHPGARPFPCPECGKTFATSSGLKQHQHIHSSVKPFQCEVCLKAYTQFSNLCRHKRMHADCRQQIKCRGCGQSFSTMHSLNKHKRYCDRMMHSASPLDLPMPPTVRAPLSIDTSSSPSLPQALRSIYNTPGITPRFPFMGQQSLPLPSLPPSFPLNSWLPPVFPSLQHMTGSDIKSPLLQKKLEEMQAQYAKSPEPVASPTSDLGNSDIEERGSATPPPASDRVTPFSDASYRTPSPKPKRAVIPALPVTPMLGFRELKNKQKENDSMTRGSLYQRICSPVESHDDVDVCDFDKSPRGSPDSGTGATESPEAPLDLSVTKTERAHSANEIKMETCSRDKDSDSLSSPKSDIYKPDSLLDIEKASAKSAFPASPFPWFSPLAILHMQELERMQYIHKMSQYVGLNGQRSPVSSTGVIRPLPLPAIAQPLDNQSIFSRFPVRSHSGLPFNGGYMRTGKDKYVCKFCGKVFPRSANLTRHLRTHTGEQPYKCKYCERSFSISSNLQRHIRNIHNKEKPFRCTVCERCFGQQTNLDRHLRKHETEGMLAAHSPSSTTEIDNDLDIEVKVDVDDDIEDEFNVVGSAEHSVCDEIDRWSNISDERDQCCLPGEMPNNGGHIDTNFSITAQIEKHKQLSIEAH